MYSIFKKFVIITQIFFSLFNAAQGQGYWQQRVEYQIAVNFNAKNHRYNGDEILKYYNNSPDTLKKVYYHLYLNAFQPNSMMDVRSRTIADPDPRVESRIAALNPDEIGYIKVNALKQDGAALSTEVSETVLEVVLNKPIPPFSTSTFEMSFEAQVPVQIRRTGRNNLGGVDYSMTQWFPKMAEYDEDGWHTSPYVAREFYAPWGDYEVDITIDKDYVLAGTGILQNRNEIGFGYEDEGVKVKKPKGSTLTWKFKAENVHDFAWAADRDYKQIVTQVPDGPKLRFFYIPGPETKTWESLPEYTVKTFQYLNEHFGKYGWSQYSVIQGGDGGMEYPMATLIANTKVNGVRNLGSLVGTMIHEVTHSWYQGMLATNESLYPWMDEGFTSFADTKTEDFVFGRNPEQPLAGKYKAYYNWVKTGREEALSTHADHFVTNSGYGIAAYVKGAMALEQLGYIIGAEMRDEGLMSYYNQWAFKHPDMNDFIRVMEKESDLELSWYFEYWINSTHTIDYAIDSVYNTGEATSIDLSKIGAMPMPIDLVVTKMDGSQSIFYIPLTMMRGEKANESNLPRTVLKDWPWTHPTYTFTIEGVPLSEIKSITIDPSGRMADVNQENNSFTTQPSN